MQISRYEQFSRKMLDPTLEFHCLLIRLLGDKARTFDAHLINKLARKMEKRSLMPLGAKEPSLKIRLSLFFESEVLQWTEIP